MKKNFVQFYYNFFDKQIGDSTLVVGLIGMMIFFAGLLSQSDLSYSKTSVLEYRTVGSENIVYIQGKKFKVVLQEVK